MQVVGVADPRDFFRKRIQDEHNLAAEFVFKGKKILSVAAVNVVCYLNFDWGGGGVQNKQGVLL